VTHANLLLPLAKGNYAGQGWPLMGGACTIGRFSDRLAVEHKSAATVGHTMVAFFMRCGEG
jgi:hypothetical protein